MTYDPPVEEMRFAIAAAGFEAIAARGGAPDAGTLTAILEEGARFAREVLAPLNHAGDREGARLENGVVRTPAGFREAYRGFVEGGWNGIGAPEAHGGQGLPLLVATALGEMWDAANMSFGLCPLLTAGAIEAVARHGCAALQDTYLAKLVSGEWTGTMNLTEPQAGSDVGALKTRAVREGDAWRITGQKIYITYGEHDLAENIVHLVLARAAGAPAGTRGISLFLVPKFLPDETGRPGRRNDVRCVGIERKLGIHASPTCVLAFGDEEGALGWLVGEENQGMACMFTMMNSARLAVGRQGVAISERAYQQARAHAASRVQGRPLPQPGLPEGAAIVWHPDVRRMLLTIRARTEAIRALTYYTAGQLDLARLGDAAARVRGELLVPMVKAWATDMGVENASLAVQVHGGMGFIEETGAAQHLRDSRIAPIYEGTNGIQALDLLNRKLGRDGGAAARVLAAEMRQLDVRLGEAGEGFATLRIGVAQGVDAFETATATLLAAEPVAAAAGASPYLTLAASTVACWLLAQAALEARGHREDFARARLTSARFFAESLLPGALAQLGAVCCGATVLAYEPDLL